MKNRVLRLTLAVILVIAMVLTMAACEPEVDPTPTPVVTPTPPTKTPPPVTPTTAPPTTAVASADEAKLAEYGITFPAEDETYDDGAAIDFEVAIDSGNVYYDAYKPYIEWTVDVEDETFEGDGVETDYIVNEGFRVAATGQNKDAGNITVYDAGIYTVTYEVEIDLADDAIKMGLFENAPVEETYVVTKTYTVDKKERELKTVSDAFVVDTVKSTQIADDGETYLSQYLVGEDYKISYDFLSANFEQVGEYPLGITILDGDENEVQAEDLVDPNFTYVVKEGTRYIITEDDAAKANAVREIFALKTGTEYVETTEYLETSIAQYDALTDAQKTFAGQADDFGGQDYTGNAIDSDDIDEAKYNLERMPLVDEIQDLIDEYNDVITNKAAVKDEIVSAFLSLSNEECEEEKEYGSDLYFVMGTLKGSTTSESTITVTSYISGDVTEDYTIDLTMPRFELEAFNDNQGELVNKEIEILFEDYLEAQQAFRTAAGKFIDFDEYNIIEDVDLDISEDSYDKVEEEIEDLNEAYAKLVAYLPDFEFAPDNAIGDADNYNTGDESIGGNSIEFTASQRIQIGINPFYEAEDTFEDLNGDMNDIATQIISRFDIYVAAIEQFDLEAYEGSVSEDAVSNQFVITMSADFEDLDTDPSDTLDADDKKEYVDNYANVYATAENIANLLGYNFKNANLTADSTVEYIVGTDNSEISGDYDYTKSLAKVLFQMTGTSPTTPLLFAQAAAAEYIEYVGYYLELQSQVIVEKAMFVSYTNSEFGAAATKMLNESLIADKNFAELNYLFDRIVAGDTISDFANYSGLTDEAYPIAFEWADVEEDGLQTIIDDVLEDEVEVIQSIIEAITAAEIGSLTNTDPTITTGSTDNEVDSVVIQGVAYDGDTTISNFANYTVWAAVADTMPAFVDGHKITSTENTGKLTFDESTGEITFGDDANWATGKELYVKIEAETDDGLPVVKTLTIAFPA